LTKFEALEILKLYDGWNLGNKSISLAFNGTRTTEDEILDERRALILEATRVLKEPDV